MRTTETARTTTDTPHGTIRFVGNQNPSHLLGRPRSWWTTVMAPKGAPSHVASGPMFDIDEIMADLRYGVDEPVPAAA